MDVLTLAGNQLTISGLTLTGGRNGIYGTTANSRFTSLTVNGNAANGIQLVDADNNFLQSLTVSGPDGRCRHPSERCAAEHHLRQHPPGEQDQRCWWRSTAHGSASGNIIQGNNILDPGSLERAA